MKRRFLLGAATISPIVSLRSGRADADPWGAAQGYPEGWSFGTLSRDTTRRVGNYSGGFERMLPVHTIRAAAMPLPLTDARRGLQYRWRNSTRTPEDYLASWPVTGLLVLRQGMIWHESYRFDRTATMRLTSWSMAKSITSLLLGICIDRGLVKSLDDTAEVYVPELRGTLHGGCTLRNLANMSSGAEIVHSPANQIIYPLALTNRDSRIGRTVAQWNSRREDQGRTFNYNELCALTIGMVVRHASGGSLAKFAQDVLWQPLGAASDATWVTDSERNEFNCMGFAARLRDWGRLGMLVAGKGQVNGRQIVSADWIKECTSWSAADRQVRCGAMQTTGLLRGYKAFMWHAKADGSQPVFNGFHAQRLFIDIPTQTVLVQTAVDGEGAWQDELYALFTAAVGQTA